MAEAGAPCATDSFYSCRRPGPDPCLGAPKLRALGSRCKGGRALSRRRHPERLEGEGMRDPAWTHCPLLRPGREDYGSLHSTTVPYAFAPTGTHRMRTGILAAFTVMLA